MVILPSPRRVPPAGARSRPALRGISARAGLVAMLSGVLTFTVTPSPAGVTGASSATAGDSSPVGDNDAVAGCHMYANRRSFGVDCSTVSVGPGVDPKDILGDEGFPECWDVPLSTEQALDRGLRAPIDADGKYAEGQYAVEMCLAGVDRETLAGQGYLAQRVRWLAANTSLRQPPTERQAALILEKGACGRLDVALIAQPSTHPRVGQDVAFRVQPMNLDCRALVTETDLGTEVVGSGDAQGSPTLPDLDDNPDTVGPLRLDDPDGVGVVEMRGTVAGFQVHWESGRGCTCTTGNGEIPPSATPGTASGCWAVFDRSSASQPGEVYRLDVIVDWQIQYRRGAGGWVDWRRVSREYRLRMPVTEIQTLVVP